MKPNATSVDLVVGARLRERRKELRLSLQQLASAMDVTYQQLQKYERGVNRVAAARLQAAAKALEVDLSFFFQASPITVDMSTDGLQPVGTAHLNGHAGLAQDLDRLGRAFIRITEPGVRQALLALAEAAARQADPA